MYGEFLHNLIARCEKETLPRASNLHQDTLKACIPLDIGSEMAKVHVIFSQECSVRLSKVREGNRFAFRDIHLLGQYLREAVDEERLSACLPVQRLDNFLRERLTGFCRVLSKKFRHLFQCERW